jgi:superfamily II DNA/RNA helicase
MRLQVLNKELLNLQRGIEDIMRQQAEENTLWGYVASFFSGNSQEAELKKAQRDVDRLQKIAARSIKESTVKQQNNLIQRHRRAIEAIYGNIRSIEMKIRAREDQERRKTEEEIRRQWFDRMKEQEKERARKAEKEREKAREAKKEREKARQAKKEKEKRICLHRGWWNRVDGRTVCSCCSVLTRKFAFQCPGCAKLACAPCRDSIKGKESNRDRRSGANNPRHSKFTRDDRYFDSDWY